MHLPKPKPLPLPRYFRATDIIPDPPDPPEGEGEKIPTAEEIKSELSKRGIAAWEAHKCCMKGRNDASRFTSEMADQIGIAIQRKDEMRVAQVPSKAIPYILWWLIRGSKVPVPKGGKPGILVPVWWNSQTQRFEEGEGMAWVDGDNHVERAQKQAQWIAGRVREKSEEMCLKCIREKVWSQEKERRGVTIGGYAKTRRNRGLSVGDLKLNLRTPHR